MIIILQRDAPRLDCQEGILTVNGVEFFTIERPWLDDKPKQSCIPPGNYGLIPHTILHGALRGLQTYALSNPVLGVFAEPPDTYSGQNPLRVACLIHPANWAFQLEGCIAPGKGRGMLVPPGSVSPEPAVLSSYAAFQEILAALCGPQQIGNSIEIIAAA